jgi:hypothetical protein
MDTTESNIPPRFRKPTISAPQERFWPKVLKQDNGCWIWQGSRTKAGYGNFTLGRRGDGHEYAHRLAYIWACDIHPALKGEASGS